MDTGDTTRFRVTDLATACALLTRLPIPGADFTRSARAAWAWPLAGVLVALPSWLAGWSLGVLGFGAPIQAGAMLIGIVLLTGAMHEDGLADTADGFWGGSTPENRLKIMRDSQIGTFGVIALTMALGLRWVALTSLVHSGTALPSIIAAAVISRAAMAPAATMLRHARTDGLSRKTGRPDKWSAGAACALGVVSGILLTETILPLIVAGIFVIGLVALARIKIGGQTGDVLGAVQQSVEIAVLITLVRS